MLNNWIAETGATNELLTANQKEKLLGKIATQYFKTVNTVLKKHDPNHLYLGSRLHAAAKNNRYIFEGAAAYVDLVSINYYGYWEPKSTHLSDWCNWGDRPFFITEFYTKAMDSGMDNISGAGWLVKHRMNGAFIIKISVCGYFHQLIVLAGIGFGIRITTREIIQLILLTGMPTKGW